MGKGGDNFYNISYFFALNIFLMAILDTAGANLPMSLCILHAALML